MTDLRTPAEIAYDAQRDGSAYTKPTPLSTGEELILKLLIELLPPDAEELPAAPRVNRSWADKLPDVAFGQLADGSTIWAEYDVTDERLGVVNAEFGNWSISADDSGVFNMGDSTRDYWELTIDQLRSLRALFVSDVFERMYAAALAWEHGQPVPAACTAPLGAA